MQYRKAIDREKIKQRQQMDKSGSKMHRAIHLLDEKILSVLRQKHQVVHDHYSFESLKTMGSSTVV